MSNMGYCRFRNTLPDLEDCAEHLRDSVETEEGRARQQLIDVCREIAAQFPEDEDEE